VPHTRLAAVGCFVGHHLATSDSDAAAAFYGKLFGWTRREIRPAGAPGHTTFRSGDIDVATAGELSPGGESRWLPCLAVRDVTTAAAEASRLGAAPEQLEGPAPGIVLIADPLGARFCMTAGAAGCVGAADAAAPGRFSWTELATDAPDSSAAFYQALAGWTSAERHVGRQGRYWVFRAGTRDVAGMVHEPGAAIASCWVPYVQVVSAEDTAALAVEVGGTLIVPPGDVPGRGRYAMLKDPGGAVVGIFALTDAA
jgi:uncharacterized protein